MSFFELLVDVIPTVFVHFLSKFAKFQNFIYTSVWTKKKFKISKLFLLWAPVTVPESPKI